LERRITDRWSLHGFFGIRQTDLIRGYFEYLVSSLLVALGIDILLRISANSRVTKEILRSVSGLLLVSAPFFFWFYYYEIVGWPFGWPYRLAPFEFVLAVSCFIIYLLGKWPIPGWISILLLAAHYSFWYFIPSSNPARADYAGPIAPILGFCSAWVWGIYVGRSR
jgi:hypothetical protein